MYQKKGWNPEIIDVIEKIEKEEKTFIEVKQFRKDIIKAMTLKNIKTIRVFDDEIRNNIINMHIANDEQNKLSKYIKELTTKKTPPNNFNLKKVKEDAVNSVIAILRGRGKVFEAFESGIFSKLKESEQSEQSNDGGKYNSFGYDTHKLSKKLKDGSLENI